MKVVTSTVETDVTSTTSRSRLPGRSVDMVIKGESLGQIHRRMLGTTNTETELEYPDTSIVLTRRSTLEGSTDTRESRQQRPRSPPNQYSQYR